MSDLHKRIRWLSSFNTLDDVLVWLEAHHVYVYAQQARDCWKALQWRNQNPDKFSGHRLDYRLNIRGKDDKVWLEISKRLYTSETP